ncbi:bis(5'-nucleosyl)-tetraphosphatase [Candidatus Endomicrobiellum devescovinae]|jgi:8-oxo-dGTP pyrophosphatase MutT (NUDIX family)|uniref:bis(5'-nucleosyl)-tetraphosphatase n=1 Tax=Candidatus Endomicrobiellum devescovinae TaxID=3242322 RepID=UPI002830BA41|nr:NUDIX domain-containing protein [Endomicrobium sp.]MDR2818319.1 NUDIX domain-containing protein [Endomicrobium sp.]
MLKETSCGAVVYKMTQDGVPIFLLVNSKRSNRWGFPKGHIENGESETETAKREIFEETGIKNVKFVENFRQEDVYLINGVLDETKGRLVEKHSVYFLALALEDALDFDKNEISKLEWADIKKAQEFLSFANQKKIIKLAYDKVIGG